LRTLTELYPGAFTSLNYTGPFQLLVATILSAQCTDTRVNKITPALFAKFPTPQSFAEADRKDIEKYVASTGFFRSKAKNIQLACQTIVSKFNGEVPGTLAELVQLAGVGRKTANVVLGDGFDTPGITVDTHVGRLSRRMGLAKETNPVKVERELMAIIPRKHWTTFSHRLILHGRAVCKSRKPRCEECAFLKVCPQIGVGEPVDEGTEETS